MDIIHSTIVNDVGIQNKVKEKIKLIESANITTKNQLLKETIIDLEINTYKLKACGLVMEEQEDEIINLNSQIDGFKNFIGDDKLNNKIIEQVKMKDNISNIGKRRNEIGKRLIGACKKIIEDDNSNNTT